MRANRLKDEKSPSESSEAGPHSESACLVDLQKVVESFIECWSQCVHRKGT